MQVITDSDLARELNILPKSFISFFKRNIKIFPTDFYFTLTQTEQQDLVQNYCNTHAERLRYAKRLPYVLTPKAVLMVMFLLKKCPKATSIRKQILAKNTEEEISNLLK